MTIASGTCGDDLTWRLEDNYYLIIEGTGTMYNYTSVDTPPWFSYRNDIVGLFIYAGLTIIGYDAFWNCRKLKDIILPSTLQGINGSAFENCVALETITIPASVTYIGQSAFMGCSSLSAINVDRGNSTYLSQGGVLYTKDFSHLLKYPCKRIGTTYQISQNTTVIEYAAFQNCRLLNYVSIPAGISSISGYAFQGCSSLQTIVFKGSYTPSIGSSAFALGISFPITHCTVRSLNGALYGALDAYTNEWTSFTYATTDVVLSLSASPSDKGSVTGSGRYSIESLVTISATPIAHCHLSSWSDGSTAATRTIVLYDDTSLTATFATDTFDISVSSDYGGTVTGGGIYDYGSTITITATPFGTYKFLKWSDGNTTNPRTFTATQNISLTAKFWAYDGELLLSYTKDGIEYMLECGTVTAVNDDVKADVLVTPIVTYTANNAFAFDSGATENLTFNIKRRNPSDAYDDLSVINQTTLPTGPWTDTHMWCNRMWKIALESFIDRWQMKTDGCRVRFVPYVKNNNGGIYQKEIDVNGYLKSLTIQYSTTSNELLSVQLSIAVGTMGR